MKSDFDKYLQRIEKLKTKLLTQNLNLKSL